MRTFLQYLSDVLTGKRKTYTFLLILIYTIVISIIPIYRLVKHGYPLVQKLPTLSRDLVDEVYPSELEIKISEGKASSNVAEPYFITIKVAKLREITESFSPSASEDLPKVSSIRLLTIDTKASVEDYEHYQTIFLLTRDNFVYMSDGQVQFTSLSTVEDMTVTKEWLVERVDDIFQSGLWEFAQKYGVFAVAIFIPLFAPMGFVFTISYFALFLYLIARIMQTGVTFKRLFIWLSLVNFPIMIGAAFAGELGRHGLLVFEVINNISTLVIIILAYYLLRPLRGGKINAATT